MCLIHSVLLCMVAVGACMDCAELCCYDTMHGAPLGWRSPATQVPLATAAATESMPCMPSLCSFPPCWVAGRRWEGGGRLAAGLPPVTRKDLYLRQSSLQVAYRGTASLSAWWLQEESQACVLLPGGLCAVCSRLWGESGVPLCRFLKTGSRPPPRPDPRLC